MTNNPNDMYKFKAYIKKIKTIGPVNAIDWEAELVRVNSLLSDNPWLSFDEVILLPFTTLTLTNEQGVYKDDLIVNKNGHLFHVVWLYGNWRVILISTTTSREDISLFSFKVQNGSHIVGNANTPEGKQIMKTGKW